MEASEKECNARPQMEYSRYHNIRVAGILCRGWHPMPWLLLNTIGLPPCIPS